MIGTGGPPRIRLSGSAAARAAELGVQIEVSLTHTDREAAAVAIATEHGDRDLSPAIAYAPGDGDPSRLARSAAGRRRAAGARRVGDRRARDPRARADGARRGRAGRPGRVARPRRAGRGRLRQGQQRWRRTASRRGVLRERGREVEVLLLGDPSELRGDARANLERLPGARAPAVRCRHARRRGRRSSTRSSAPASPGSRASPRPARSRRSTTPARDAGACVIACDVPSGVDASTGEIAGAGGAGARHRDLQRRQAGAVDRARQGARRRGDA